MVTLYIMSQLCTQLYMILFNETRDGDIVHNVSVMYTEDTQLIQ